MTQKKSKKSLANLLALSVGAACMMSGQCYAADMNQNNQADSTMNSCNPDMQCKGKSDCKGKDGCKTSMNECKGQNSCKGQDSCPSHLML